MDFLFPTNANLMGEILKLKMETIRVALFNLNELTFYSVNADNSLSVCQLNE